MATTQSHFKNGLARLEDRLKLWHAKFNAAVASSRVTRQEAKIDSGKQLDEIKSKLEAAQARLDEAKAAGSEKWDTVKDGVEHTWHDLEQAFKKLLH
jgi:phage shock protein A